LDSFTNPASTDNLNTTGVLHDVQHSDANNAVVAVETELGVNPSGSFADVAAAITAIRAPSTVKVTRTTDQSIPNLGGGTMVAFTAETFDTDNWHDNATNNSRITCPTGKGGTYMVIGWVAWASGAGGTQRTVGLMKNGVKVVSADQPIGYASPVGMFAQDIIALAAGDYIELMTYQTSGGSLNLDVSNFAPCLSAIYLGP
jgi:hypothetical protein